MEVLDLINRCLLRATVSSYLVFHSLHTNFKSTNDKFRASLLVVRYWGWPLRGWKQFRSCHARLPYYQWQSGYHTTRAAETLSMENSISHHNTYTIHLTRNNVKHVPKTTVALTTVRIAHWNNVTRQCVNFMSRLYMTVQWSKLKDRPVCVD